MWVVLCITIHHYLSQKVLLLNLFILVVLLKFLIWPNLKREKVGNLGCEFWVKKYRETGTSFFEFHPYRREYGIVPNWYKEKTKWLCVQVVYFDKKTSAKHCVVDHKGLSDFHIGMAYGFQKKFLNIPLW